MGQSPCSHQLLAFRVRLDGQKRYPGRCFQWVYRLSRGVYRCFENVGRGGEMSSAAVVVMMSEIPTAERAARLGMAMACSKKRDTDWMKERMARESSWTSTATSTGLVVLWPLHHSGPSTDCRQWARGPWRLMLTQIHERPSWIDERYRVQRTNKTCLYTHDSRQSGFNNTRVATRHPSKAGPAMSRGARPPARCGGVRGQKDAPPPKAEAACLSGQRTTDKLISV